jgi:hypothetical protein
VKRGEREHVTDIRNAADKLLAADDFAEEYFARTLLVQALGNLNEWVAESVTRLPAETNVRSDDPERRDDR